MKSPDFWAHATALFFVFLCVVFLFAVKRIFEVPLSPLTIVLGAAAGYVAGLVFFVAVAIGLSITMYPLE